MKGEVRGREAALGHVTPGQRAIDRHRWQLSGVFSVDEGEAVRRRFAAAGFAVSPAGERRWLCTLYLRGRGAVGDRARVRFYLAAPISRISWHAEGVLIVARFVERMGRRQERIVETTKERSAVVLRELVEQGGAEIGGAVTCYRDVLEASHSRLTIDTRRQYCAATIDADGVRLRPVLTVDEPKLELKYGAAMAPELVELFPARSRDVRTNLEILRACVGPDAAKI
jgi:hypothetical protein